MLDNTVQSSPCPPPYADDTDRPSLAELHADDVARGAIRINDELWQGRHCCLVPDPVVVGRWNTIVAFRSLKQAEAFTLGYCARRDGHGPHQWAR